MPPRSSGRGLAAYNYRREHTVETSEVRRRVQQALTNVRAREQERRRMVAEAQGAYDTFLAIVAVPLTRQVANALKADPSLDKLQPWVEDSGEGRWTVEESINTSVPAPVIAMSLLMRFRSRQDNSFSSRMLAAMRQQFGGHAVKSK